LLQPPPGPASFALGIGNMGPAMSFTKSLILQFHRIFDDDPEVEPLADEGDDDFEDDSDLPLDGPAETVPGEDTVDQPDPPEFSNLTNLPENTPDQPA